MTNFELSQTLICIFVGGMELYENYDDDGEEGAGEKLLHLLQKMGVENIFIVV